MKKFFGTLLAYIANREPQDRDLRSKSDCSGGLACVRTPGARRLAREMRDSLAASVWGHESGTYKLCSEEYEDCKHDLEIFKKIAG